MTNIYIENRLKVSQGYASEVTATRKRKFSTIESGINNKADYILTEWQTSFPIYSHLSYSDITALASRSREVNRWLVEKNEAYQLTINVPSWFTDAGKSSNDWTTEMTEKVMYIKEINRDYSQRIAQISLKTKNEIQRLNSELSDKIRNELLKTPELVLSLYNTQILPIDIHLRSMECKTKEEAKEYLNNQLHNYRVQQYEDFVSGKISAQSLVDTLFEK